MSDDLEESLKKLQSLKNRPNGITSKDWNVIKKGVRELQKRKDAPFNPQRHKAETQADLAKMFIRYYFLAIFLILLYVPSYNWLIIKLGGTPDDLITVRDAFMMVSSAITPLLAFVLGHYFKGKD